MRTHLFIVLSLLLVTGAAYTQLAESNYCGFDDAMELQRLTFHDPGTLAADLGTVLFSDALKYRPGMMTLNRMSYRAADHKARGFRIRNIVSHMLITVTLYGVGVVLFGSLPVAAVGALLFGLNPLANQGVALAVSVIAPANLCLILSFLLFLISLRAARHANLWVAAAIAVGSLGVLIYDPVIVVYGLIYLYFFIWLLQKKNKRPSISYFATLLGLTLLFLATWFALRTKYLHPGKVHPAALGVFLQNSMIYVAAPLQFVDPLFSNYLLDTPLPPEVLQGDIPVDLIAVVVLPALFLGLLLVSRLQVLRKNLTRDDLVNFAFLILAWGGSLLPYLMFNPHPSETYNYVGFMMLMLILSRLLHAAFLQNGSAASRGVYAVVVVAILTLYISAVVVKNSRVYACGQIFGHILADLPSKLQQGSWDVTFANVPGEPATRAYGTYGYKGIAALGIGTYGEPGIAAALQFAFHNPEISAKSVDARSLNEICASPQAGRLCYWVHADGGLDEAGAHGRIPSLRP